MVPDADDNIKEGCQIFVKVVRRPEVSEGLNFTIIVLSQSFLVSFFVDCASD